VASAVLDASALLAYMHGEPGERPVAEALANGCAISIVNLAEALSKLADEGEDPAAVLDRLGSLGDTLEILSFEAADAVRVAALRPLTKRLGLSLGDRACLALAERLGLPVLTADRGWRQLELALEVVFVRN